MFNAGADPVASGLVKLEPLGWQFDRRGMMSDEIVPKKFELLTRRAAGERGCISQPSHRNDQAVSRRGARSASGTLVNAETSGTSKRLSSNGSAGLALVVSPDRSISIRSKACGAGRTPPHSGDHSYRKSLRREADDYSANFADNYRLLGVYAGRS